VKVSPDLRDERTRDGKLGQFESGNRQLADAEYPRSKLRDGYHIPGKLADGDHPFGWYWHAIGTKLERQCRMGSPKSVACDVYSNPHPSHFSLAGYGTPQLAQRGACSEIVFTFPAGFH